MPQKTTKIKASSVKDYRVIIGSGQNTWKPGVISLVDESRLPLGAVVKAQNLMQTQDGVWSTRWGSNNYGATFTGPVTAFSDFLVYNGDGTTTQYYAVIDNGAFKYAKDGGAWTTVTGYSFNTTVWTNLLQYENKLLISNGIDAFSYVDLTTMTWVGFTTISAPATPTFSLGAGLSAGSFTYYIQVTAVNKVGETLPCAALTVTTNINRNQWYNPQSGTVSSNTLYVDYDWAQVTGAIGYNVYISDGISGVSYFLDSVNQPDSGDAKYRDYGSSAINDFIQVPATDTTGAPKFSWVALSDNRLWAIGDPANPNRLYWAGTGPAYALAFNPFVGGGWVDIMPGGPQMPYFVGQFRDGKGSPMTTLLLSSPTGYGTVWHCTINTDTIGNTAIAVPSLMQSMSTFGSTAPRSVVQTQQNVYYHSPGPAGFYSNGSVPTLFNVLATNEVSYLIRPDIQAINLSAAGGIAGIEFQKRLLWSVPYGSTTNNRIMVYDLGKQNWNPYAFDFGVKHFIRYTDNSGSLHLLAIPTTGTKILEINPNFIGDNGVGTTAHLQTGLIHVAQDHIQFAHIRYIYYEFGSPNGVINLVFAGTTKNLPLSQISTHAITLGDTASNVGFDSFAFSTEPFSFATVAPLATTQLSVKERVRITKLLNNWEAEVYSNTLSSSWTLNQIIVVGFLIPTQDPSAWIVG